MQRSLRRVHGYWDGGEIHTACLGYVLDLESLEEEHEEACRTLDRFASLQAMLARHGVLSVETAWS